MNPSQIKLRKLEDEYVVHKSNAIGEGAYGQVFKAERRGQPGQTFAVKVMHPQGEGGTYKLVTSNASLREIKLLRELTHPNIVTLRDQFVNLDDMSLALVYDYAKTDLRVMIWDHKRMKKSMPERVIRAFMFQLLQGVMYLHENWILHRDLKPANILVEKQLTECHAGTAKNDFALGVPWLKICDFGLARIFQAPVKALSEVERVVATLWYRAPELLLGSRHYTTAVDVWAVGCIFAEMYNRQPLFPGSEVAGKGAPFQEAQCKTIFKVLGVPKESTWPGVSHMPSYKHISGWGAGYPSESILRKTVPSMTDPHALDLLARLLELDPAKRISADEALQHEYFRPIRDMEVSAVQARQQARGTTVNRPKKRPRNTLAAVLADAAARGAASGAGVGAGAGAGGVAVGAAASGVRGSISDASLGHSVLGAAGAAMAGRRDAVAPGANAGGGHDMRGAPG